MFKRPPTNQQPPTLYAFPTSNSSAGHPPNAHYPYGAPQYPYQRPSAPPVAPGYSAAAYGPPQVPPPPPPPPHVDPRWNFPYQGYQQMNSSLQVPNHHHQQQQQHVRSHSLSGYVVPPHTSSNRVPQQNTPYPPPPKHRLPPGTPHAAQAMMHLQPPPPNQQSSNGVVYPSTPSQPHSRANFAHPFPSAPPQPVGGGTRRPTYTQEYIDSLPALPAGLKYFLGDATVLPSRGENTSQRPISRERSSASAHNITTADGRLQAPSGRATPSRQHSSSSVHDTFSQRLYQALNPGQQQQQPSSSSAHAHGLAPATPRALYPQTPPHSRSRRPSTSSQTRPFVVHPPRNSSPRSVTIPDSYTPSVTSREGHRPPTPKYPTRELPAEDREEREVYRPSEEEKRNTFENGQTERRHLLRKPALPNEAKPKRQYSEMNYELLPTIRRMSTYPHVEWYVAYPPNTAIHHIGLTQQIPLDMQQSIIHPPVKMLHIGSQQSFMKPFHVVLGRCISIRLSREVTVGDVFSAMYEFFQRPLSVKEIRAVKADKELYEMGRENRKRRLAVNPRSGKEPSMQDLLEGPVKFNGFMFDSTFHNSGWIWLVVDRLA